MQLPMDIGTDELLTLLSDRVRSEMARTEIEQQRTTEIRWLFKQQEYLLETVRDFFGEIAQRIDDLEDLILSKDLYRRGLRKALAKEMVNVNKLREERAARGGEVTPWQRNQIEDTEERIKKMRDELTELDEGPGE